MKLITVIPKPELEQVRGSTRRCPKPPKETMTVSPVVESTRRSIGDMGSFRGNKPHVDSKEK
jgi:hypothetical protein